jgi:hypothetical protein
VLREHIHLCMTQSSSQYIVKLIAFLHQNTLSKQASYRQRAQSQGCTQLGTGASQSRARQVTLRSGMEGTTQHTLFS